MRLVEIRRQCDPPREGEAPDAASQYVDYLLTRLVTENRALLEAEPAEGDDPVEWRLFDRQRRIPPVVVERMPRVLFRPVLARIGFRLTSEQDPYVGSGTFRVRFDDEPQPREKRFCVYLANMQGVGHWARVYWFGGA